LTNNFQNKLIMIIFRLGGLYCDTVTRVAVVGSGSTGGANGIGTSTSFNDIHGISLSPDASVALIADMHVHKIRKVVFANLAVSPFAGSGTAGGANGVGTLATLNAPNDVTISSDGLFALVVDYSGQVVRKIVMATRAVSTIAGVYGASGSSNGIGTSVRFSGMACVRLYATDTLALIADKDNRRIRKLVVSTGAVSTVAGTGVSGHANGAGASATFVDVYGIAITSDNSIAIVSEWTGAMVRKIVLSSWTVSTLF
jgi:hypothetical protein